MKKLTIPIEIEVDDDFRLLIEHNLWEENINEVRQLFYKKNHDYCSSWRMEDESSIAREIGQRVVRILRGLQLRDQGKSLKSSEGIYEEFRDIVNWCIFAMAIMKGHGWNPEDLIIGYADGDHISEEEFSDEQESSIEDVNAHIEDIKSSFDDICEATRREPISNIPSSSLAQIANLNREIMDRKAPVDIYSKQDDRYNSNTYFPPNVLQGKNQALVQMAKSSLIELEDKYEDDSPSIVAIQKNDALSNFEAFILCGMNYCRTDCLPDYFFKKIGDDAIVDNFHRKISEISSEYVVFIPFNRE